MAGLVVRRRRGLRTWGTRSAMNRPRALRSRRTGYQRAAVCFMVLVPSLAVAAGAFCAPAAGHQEPRPARLAVNPLPAAQAAARMCGEHISGPRREVGD
jgi:hypothetical protein